MTRYAACGKPHALLPLPALTLNAPLSSHTAPVDPRLAPSMRPQDVIDFIRSRARTYGFSAVGFSPADELAEDGERLDRWLAEGSAGLMGYMHNHRALRTNASVLHPGAKTVISFVVPYQPLVLDGRNARIAAYAHGVDYHELFRDTLNELLQDLEAFLGFSVNGRAITDSAPLLERATARRAGLGWVGRSAMLIHPRRGTYTLLCELLIDLPLYEEVEPIRNHCGRCRACVDACPTGAIRGDGSIDAKKCISYLTIELKGSIPREFRAPIGEQMFGCDICQAVCPWNRFADDVTMDALAPREALETLDATDMLRVDRQTFNRMFKGTALHRTKRRGLARNAAIVLGNRRDRAALDALIEALHTHDEPLVREHVVWALSEFIAHGPAPHREQAKDALLLAFEQEIDDTVRHELEWVRATYDLF